MDHRTKDVETDGICDNSTQREPLNPKTQKPHDQPREVLQARRRERRRARRKGAKAQGSECRA